MPRFSLIERRPILLASVAAATGYFVLNFTAAPNIILILLAGGALALLAACAFICDDGADAKLLGMAMAAASISLLLRGIEPLIASYVDFASLALLLGLFLKFENRQVPDSGQRIVALLLFLGTPAYAFLASWGSVSLLYGLLPGAMAAGAWISRFAPHHAGTGAVMIVFSRLLLVTPPANPTLSLVGYHLQWPLHFFGMLLICTAVARSLSRDEDLRDWFR